MVEFIERDIRHLRDSSNSERTTLLVGYDGDPDELAETIEALDGRIQDRIGRTTLRVLIPKSEVGQLFEIDSIISIERDKDDVALQSQGNFRHQTDSMM